MVGQDLLNSITESEQCILDAVTLSPHALRPKQSTESANAMQASQYNKLMDMFSKMNEKIEQLEKNTSKEKSVIVMTATMMVPMETMVSVVIKREGVALMFPSTVGLTVLGIIIAEIASLKPMATRMTPRSKIEWEAVLIFARCANEMLERLVLVLLNIV